MRFMLSLLLLIGFILPVKADDRIIRMKCEFNGHMFLLNAYDSMMGDQKFYETKNIIDDVSNEYTSGFPVWTLIGDRQTTTFTRDSNPPIVMIVRNLPFDNRRQFGLEPRYSRLLIGTDILEGRCMVVIVSRIP